VAGSEGGEVSNIGLIVMPDSVLPPVRYSGDVARYHAWPTITKQTVAHHTWNVVRLLLEICPEAPRHVLVAAQYHDAAEVATGDVPFHVKRRWPEVKAAMKVAETAVQHLIAPLTPELSPVEEALLKAADLSEMAEFSIHELDMGNRHALAILKNICNALWDIWSSASATGETWAAPLSEKLDGYIEECNRMEVIYERNR
jgi:5'-deoxynucleotidase YfbR-like HD superfamily hydrolase